MPLTDFVTGRSNRIVIGGLAGVGLIVTASAAISAFVRPAYRVESPDGDRVWEVTTKGALGFGSGADAFGDAGDCIRSGGGSGTINYWDTCGSGGGVDTGAILNAGNDRFVNVSGDTMTGALNVNVNGGNLNTVGIKVIQTLSGAHVHGERSLTASGTFVVEGTGSFVSTAAGQVPLTVRASASQTASVQELQNSAGAPRLQILYPNPTEELGSPLFRFYRSDGAVSGDFYFRQNANRFFMSRDLQVDGSLQLATPVITGAGFELRSTTGAPVHLRATVNNATHGTPSVILDTFAATATVSPLVSIRNNGTEKASFSGSGWLAIGNSTSNAETPIEAAGTISGTTVYAQASLRSSGTLVFEGAASGSSLYVGTSIEGAGLTDCDGDTQTVSWDATTKRFGCGDDDTGGSGAPEVGTISFSGGVLRLADPRYVNTSGDTMTGALNILVTGGTNRTVGLEVFGTASGSRVHAQDIMTSSGGIFVEGVSEISGVIFGIGSINCNTSCITASEVQDNELDFADLQDTLDLDANLSINSAGFAWVWNEDGNAAGDFRAEGDTLTHLLFIDASADSVGVNTSAPKARFDVVGTVSGSALVINGLAQFNTGATISRLEDKPLLTFRDRTNSRSAMVLTGSGTPYNVVAASTGSLFHDNYKGWLYTKVTDGTKGWRALQPTSATGTTFPSRADVWMDAVNAVNGSWTASNQNGQNYEYYVFSSGADGNAFTSGFYLKAGTYTLSALGVASPTRGKIDFYIDGTLAASGLDFYNVGTVFNSKQTATVTVSTDGWHLLRGVVNGRNASATGFEMLLTKIWLSPATDAQFTSPRFP